MIQPTCWSADFHAKNVESADIELYAVPVEDKMTKHPSQP